MALVMSRLLGEPIYLGLPSGERIIVVVREHKRASKTYSILIEAPESVEIARSASALNKKRAERYKP